MDVFTQAQAELGKIDSEIALLEMRRDSLRQFVTLGAKLYGDHAQADLLGGIPEPKVRATGRVPLKRRIVELAHRFIKENGPTTTKDLVDLIEREGVEITGADKSVTVSVVLSRSNEFASDRRLGWSLAKEESPHDATTSAGSPAGEPDLNLNAPQSPTRTE